MNPAEAIEDAIRWEVEGKRIPSISYALVDRQRVLASGHVALTGTIEPTASSLFRIGSLTKMITSVALMQLVEAGRLGLDDDIGDHLQVARGATLRQILSHTSGLTREARVGHYLDDSEPALAETVSSLAAFPRKIASGAYRYSNAGFALLGAVIEACAAMPYADYVRDRIFTPLGMTDSAVGFDAKSKARLAPAGMWGFAGDTPAPLFNLGGPAAGSIVSTLGDMARFAQAMLGDGLLPRKAMETLWSIPSGSERGYGLGFAIDRLDARRTIGHGGVVYGYASLLTALPDDGLAIVLFGTMDMTNSVLSRIGSYALRLALAERGDGKPPETLIRTTVLIRRELAGDLWKADGSDRIELRERDDGTFLLENSVPLEIRANGTTLVIDGRLQGRDADGAFVTVEVVPEGIRWRGELWTAQQPPVVGPPDKLAPYIGAYGPKFLPLHLFFRDGKLRCSAEGLVGHVCDPIGGNRYVMRGSLLDDEILEVGLVENGRPAIRVGEVLFQRLD